MQEFVFITTELWFCYSKLVTNGKGLSLYNSVDSTRGFVTYCNWTDNSVEYDITQLGLW